MADSQRTWTIALDVRADAERMFVPRSQLPSAVVGDGVTARTSGPGPTRHGVVIDVAEEHLGASYLVVAFEPPPGGA